MNRIKTISCIMSMFVSLQAYADVASYVDHIKKNPSALYVFFKKMPKGGELHYHLAGGPYPETMLRLAAQGNYCFDKKTFVISKMIGASCPNGISSQEAFQQPKFYEQVVRAWSLKDFVPGAESSHDHFFNSFLKFFPIVEDYQPELVANVMKRAANQEEQYLELLVLADNGYSLKFGNLIKNASSLAEKRKILLANKEFQQNITQTASEMDRVLAQARKTLDCDKNPQTPACKLSIKFLFYSLREQPINSFFAQTLTAFAATEQSQSRGGSLIGINIVQPEDGFISLRDYQQQMKVYEYLHPLYPKVPISLHAGELVPGLVEPSDLNDHIHNALFIGQAQRIGHGVDIAYENNAEATLNYMAKEHKTIEINLTSNHKILNAFGKNHPLNYYLKHHVPVVLSTDDEGILRTDLTSQYVQAVLEHDLDYPTIKQINRNALTYAFVSGKSIWANAEKAQLIPECQDLQSKLCLNFIKDNEKAKLQWTLEHKLNDFEKDFDKA